MSHLAGLRVNGLRPGVERASGGVFAGLDLGIVPPGPLVACWIWGARAPLYSMVERCHEAWQEASVSNQGSVSGVRVREHHPGVAIGALSCQPPPNRTYGFHRILLSSVVSPASLQGVGLGCAGILRFSWLGATYTSYSSVISCSSAFPAENPPVPESPANSSVPEPGTTS